MWIQIIGCGSIIGSMRMIEFNFWIRIHVIYRFKDYFDLGAAEIITGLTQLCGYLVRSDWSMCRRTNENQSTNVLVVDSSNHSVVCTGRRTTQELNGIGFMFNIMQDRASCMSVHGKFLVLGTDYGVIHLLDAMGNSLTSRTKHSHSGKHLKYWQAVLFI